MEYRKGLLFILILLEVALALFMVYENSSGTDICASGKSCGAVQNSIYGQIFGIKLTELAVIAFVALFIVYYLVYREKVHYNFFVLCTLVGAGMAIYFISLQLFVLHEICSNCMIVDGIAIVIFVVSIIEFWYVRKNSKAPMI